MRTCWPVAAQWKDEFETVLKHVTDHGAVSSLDVRGERGKENVPVYLRLVVGRTAFYYGWLS